MIYLIYKYYHKLFKEQDQTDWVNHCKGHMGI